MSLARPSSTSDSRATRAGRVRWGVHVTLAAALYLAASLWVLRPVLRLMTAILPYPTVVVTLPGNWLPLVLNDELLTASFLTHNARDMSTAPWRLSESWQCYPMTNGRALGEHMLGMGLRGVVPYAVTGDPVATTNIVLIALPVMAGMAMYALVAYWTRLPAAALVAGLLFAFQPPRLTNLVHPYVEANDWTVIALLGAHLFFTRGWWRDAALLATAIVLQTLESFYPLLALTAIGGTYGAYLTARHWRRLPILLPKLAVVVLAVAVVGALVFTPYLHARVVWGSSVGGRATLLSQLQEFGRGHQAYVGSVTVALMLIALLERLWRRRDEHGYDPRIPFAVAGLMVVWLSTSGVSLPFGVQLPSLFTLAAGVIPGLDSIRAGGVIGRGGVPIVATFLAGFGVFVLLERCRPITRTVVTAAIAAAALADVFVPKQATRDFGTQVTMGVNYVRPKPELLALYSRLPDGPLLDIPFLYTNTGLLTFMPHYVFLSAYHHRPIGGCYNSFLVRIQEDIATIAARLPSRNAVDALAALGFRSMMVHDEFIAYRIGELHPLTGAAVAQHPIDPELTHLTYVDRAANHTAYVLDHPVASTTNDTALALAAASASEPAVDAATVHAPRADVAFLFRNSSAEVYHHPPPIEPTLLRLRWDSTAGTMVHEDRVREMLPLALAPGETLLRTINVPVTVAPGQYEVTLSRDENADVVLSRQRVNVAPPGETR